MSEFSSGVSSGPLQQWGVFGMDLPLQQWGAFEGTSPFIEKAAASDLIASGRCGRPKPVVLFLIQFLLNSERYDEKHQVNRPSILSVDLE